MWADVSISDLPLHARISVNGINNLFVSNLMINFQIKNTDMGIFFISCSGRALNCRNKRE